MNRYGKWLKPTISVESITVKFTRMRSVLTNDGWTLEEGVEWKTVGRVTYDPNHPPFLNDAPKVSGQNAVVLI